MRSGRTIVSYLARGGIVAFDEFAHPKWPGQTAALRVVLDMRQFSLHQLSGRERRHALSPLGTRISVPNHKFPSQSSANS